MPGIAQPPAAPAGTRYSTSTIRFGRPAASAAEAEPSDSGKFAFWLLATFFFLLYSNIVLLFPVLEILRPALTLGALAMVVLLWEKVSSGQSIELVSPDTYFLFAFIAMAGLSVFGALWQGYAVEATVNLMKCTVAYLLILNTVNSAQRLRWLMWVMFLCGLFPALGTLRNWHAGHLVEGRASWVGIFANANEMAYALVVLVPIGYILASELPFFKRLPVYAILCVFALAIYVSYSRGSLIGLFAVAAYLGLRQKSKIARLLMIALLVAAAAAVPLYWSRGAGFSGLSSDASVQQRLDTYKTALRMYADHPLLGVGINCSAVAWPLYSPKGLTYNTWLITHNTFLQAAAETGTIGVVVFLLFLGAAARRAWKVSRHPRLGQETTGRLMTALEISLWGFIVCGLSGGYVMSWFPYLITGLIAAGGKIADEPAA